MALRSADPDLERIRSQSRQLAAGHGYEIMGSLPLLDPNPIPRPATEVARRSLALLATLWVANGLDADQASEWLVSEDLVDALTPSEHAILADGPETHPTTTNTILWQVEAVWALAWTLRLTRTLDVTKSVGDEMASLFPDVPGGEEAGQFVSSAALRSREELIQMLDLIYCVHWAVADARLSRGEVLPGLEEPRILERRRALEWVMCDEEWDELSLDT